MVIPSEKMLNLTRRGNAVLPVAQLSGGVRQLHLGEKKASQRSKRRRGSRPVLPTSEVLLRCKHYEWRESVLPCSSAIDFFFFPWKSFEREEAKRGNFVSRRPDKLR